MIWEIPISGGGIVNKFEGRKKRKKEEGEGLREKRLEGMGEREKEGRDCGSMEARECLYLE